MQVSVVPHAEPRRLTRAEYDRMAERGFFRGERVELIRGIVVRMAPIGPAHSDAVDRIGKLLARSMPDDAASGVPEHWIVDLAGHAVEVHTAPSGGRYTRVRRVESGETLVPGAFPDLTLAIADFFG